MLFFTSCENPWDEHVKVNDNVLEENIGNYLSSNTEFSKFNELLVTTGMDAVLSSSVIYTVWAPTNEAINAVDPSELDTYDKMKLFVQNHIAFGNYSSKSKTGNIRLTMRSGKALNYNTSDATIDGVTIDKEKEKVVSNGTIQVINTALTPRYSIWQYIEMKAPDCEFVSFLNSLTTKVFYPDSSEQVGVNENGKPVYDSVWIEENYFLKYIDISSENTLFTLIIPSNEVFEAEFNKFQNYYRIEDKRNNEFPTIKDSVYTKLMIARDMALGGKYNVTETNDTMLSFYNVKVPFKKSAVTQSVEASNGYVHFLNDCSVKITDKIKPILMEAENNFYSINSNTGTPRLFRRLRDDASNGMDFICDNAHSSQLLSGVVFAGPVVSSIKYRVKIRAVNDFGKSYANSDTSVVLIQKLGTVTILRDPITNIIKTVSEVTNSLNYTNTAYGTADVTSDTMSVTRKAYSPLIQAEDDEIDLGYYEFNKSDNVFLRLIPLSSKMAVTADYFRLVPIIE